MPCTRDRRVFIALTYMVPAAGRAHQHRLDVTADRFLVSHGFGGTLASLLRRHGQPITMERLQLPEVPTGPCSGRRCAW